MKILAFGATGHIAGLVPPELARRGATVRAFVTREDQRDAALAAGAQDVVVGDLRDADSVAWALSGQDGVFYIAPIDLADQAAIGVRLIGQAVDAGVRRFTFSSVVHPVLALPNHAAKAPVEAALVSSRLDYAILHPTVLFQNLDAAWDDILATGIFAEPWSNEIRHSRVDYRDVAEVAALTLLEDRWANATLELSAPGDLDRHEMAGIIGDEIGRPVAAKRIDPATLGEKAAPLLPMFEHYDRHGLRGNPETLRIVLGREPRSFRDYVGGLLRDR